MCRERLEIEFGRHGNAGHDEAGPVAARTRVLEHAFRWQ
jgi:hypothetical protein